MIIQFCTIGTPSWYQIGDNWYFFRKQFSNFFEANLLCEELGAKLFEPNSLNIQNIILDIPIMQTLPIWLGITNTGKYQSESKWQWLSNNSLTDWASENAENALTYDDEPRNCLYLNAYRYPGPRHWDKTR